MFKDAYRRRRCILPVDRFYKWKAIKGQRAKQPYAIAMRDGKPFGIGGLWENWKDPTSGEWIRTFTSRSAVAFLSIGTIRQLFHIICQRRHGATLI
jgi:putative SOS response-associated peptidase YedK